MAKKVCKKCKVFVEGSKCQLCGGNDLTETWKGKVVIINAEESEIAKNINIKKPGNYAIKTR